MTAWTKSKTLQGYDAEVVTSLATSRSLTKQLWCFLKYLQDQLLKPHDHFVLYSKLCITRVICTGTHEYFAYLYSIMVVALHVSVY